MFRNYYFVAALLGAGWFPVLLLSPYHKELVWLGGGWETVFSLLSLIVTALIVARVFRRYVLSSDNLGEDCLRGFLLPFAGCVVHLTFVNLEMSIRSGQFFTHDQFVLYPWGLAVTFFCLPLIFSYGLFSQWLLRRAGQVETVFVPALAEESASQDAGVQL